MNRRQKQSVILGALVCVMAVVYVRAFAPRTPVTRATVPSKTAPDAPVAALAAPGTLAPQEVIARREAQRARASELSWNRDPFTLGRGTGPGGFTLSGILWDTQRPIAIINGQMLQVGEELDGYRVAEISQDRVSLTDGAHTYQLLIAP